MQINWTVLTYFVIGLFALNGFFRGWWKEAITTVFLTFLVLLLAQPQIAQNFIEVVNAIVQTVWAILPKELLAFLFRDAFSPGLGASTASNGIQIDPGDGNTWLILLILFIAGAVILGRFTLPGYGPNGGYQVRPVGSLLGGLVGGLNGLIVINLVREYIDGRNLPGATSGLPTEIVSRGAGGVTAMASSGVSIQAVDVPTQTILDSYLPWVIIIIGAVIFLAALKTRIGLARQNGFSKIDYKAPLGYKKY